MAVTLTRLVMKPHPSKLANQRWKSEPCIGLIRAQIGRRYCPSALDRACFPPGMHRGALYHPVPCRIVSQRAPRDLIGCDRSQSRLAPSTPC